jgi:membrane protease YdiL (CAAX protease family)
MPILGIAGYIHIRSGKPLPPKSRRYRSMIVFQWLLLLITVAGARESGEPLLGGRFPGPLAWLIAAAYLTFFTFRLRRVWVKLSPERRDQSRVLLPDHPSLMRKWVVISALAGVTEECAYRGLTFRILTANHGSVPLALFLCIVCFGVAHMSQGWRGFVATSLVAAIMHAAVFITGSLYLAIVIHAVYDLIVGIVAMPILYQDLQQTQMEQPVEA